MTVKGNQGGVIPTTLGEKVFRESFKYIDGLKLVLKPTGPVWPFSPIAPGWSLASACLAFPGSVLDLRVVSVRKHAVRTSPSPQDDLVAFDDRRRSDDNGNSLGRINLSSKPQFSRLRNHSIQSVIVVVWPQIVGPSRF